MNLSFGLNFMEDKNMFPMLGIEPFILPSIP
jgi:hypothetical protein